MGSGLPLIHFHFFFRTIQKKRMLKKQITAQVAASMIHAERVIE
jgi:hypothetical protein